MNLCAIFARVLLLYLTWWTPDNVCYSPILTWDVCSPSRIIVTLTGGADTGIIYIKGYGAACKQMTSSNVTTHEFDFDSCGMVGETYFTIIVQKNPLYQTGYDLQESLLCIYDLSDITVGNSVNVGDKEDDAGINKTVKPTAQMRLYKDGLDISGSDVKLTDLITLTIQLDDEFLDDFDLNARSCTANFLDIIKDSCAVDDDLFPTFLHATGGVVTSTFGAFRTTDLSGGYVEMIFSCTLQVCRGSCSPTTCTDGDEGWGRKKRAIDDVTYEDVNVGASLSVGNDVDITPSAPTDDHGHCVDDLAFIVGLAAILTMLLTSCTLTCFVTNKLLKRTDEIQKLRGDYENQKKSFIAKKAELPLGRKSSVTIINTNSTPIPITVKQTDRQTDDVTLTTPKPTLQNQASVSVMYNHHTTSLHNKSNVTKHVSPGNGISTIIMPSVVKNNQQTSTKENIHELLKRPASNQAIINTLLNTSGCLNQTGVTPNMTRKNTENVQNSVNQSQQAAIAKRNQLLECKAFLTQIAMSPMTSRRQ